MTAAHPVLVIGGPTASGKSALALQAARQFSGTVINADSMQLYGALPILTAQPSAAEQAELPHRLYGVLAPQQVAGAGRWRQMALEAIDAARGEGRLPIVVGGTGLYIRSLLQGLSPIPDVPADSRQEAERLWAELGPESFRRRLAERDPALVARLQPADRQRHVRGMEVLLGTGRPLSQWQAEPPSGPPPGLRFLTIVLDPPRAMLRQAAETRFAAMLQAGALDELRALLAQDSGRTSPLLQALGVPQLAAHLDGKMPLDQAVSLAVTATRQYAKRQQTWFRHQIIADLIFEKQLSETNMSEIFSFIRQSRLTAP